MTAEAEWSWGRLAKCERDLGSATPRIDGVESSLATPQAETVTTPTDRSGDEGERLKGEELTPPRKPAGVSFAPADSQLDFGDVENERRIMGRFE
ncbi:unnamed protein product [Acanthoscelides obtectus]|uniref:Uncharacterized protein n=1 Tax=Acanthoscelides obtectus TaxID=200917 RepID=A0A9P0Q329_ACAOB|nr:unnamed protein product [Acanthoscelides obtectus]CAK1637519.1 hypothetical protein AOBTE_LOCUS10018 [Acanthoscelides obtectus]